MGAMIIGLVTGGIAWICIIAMNIVLATVIFIDACYHKMKAIPWALMALLFNLYAVPVYLIVRIKIARLKCDSCGAKVKHNECFCAVCGNAVKKIDDGKIARNVILYVIAAFVIFIVLGVLFDAIISILNP